MKLFIQSLIFSTFFLSATMAYGQSDGFGQPLNEAMQTFKEACLTERRALNTKSQLTMGKAHKLFLSLKMAPFKYKIVSESPENALGAPVMQFTPQYCEQLMRTSFSIVPLDTLHAMRDDDFMQAELLHDNFSLMPNSSCTISIRASGNCSMVIVSEEGLPVSVSSSIDGEPLPFNSEENGTVNWQTWTLPRTKRDMEFKLVNPNDRIVSFTIGVQ